jgi:hypothetical protein
LVSRKAAGAEPEPLSLASMARLAAPCIRAAEIIAAFFPERALGCY